MRSEKNVTRNCIIKVFTMRVVY